MNPIKPLGDPRETYRHQNETMKDKTLSELNSSSSVEVINEGQ